MKFKYLKNLELPAYPNIDNSEILSSYVKADAYITIALEEANVNHNRSKLAAITADMTHDLEVKHKNYSPKEYLMDAQLEIDTICNELDEPSWFITDLGHVNDTINKSINNY